MPERILQTPKTLRDKAAGYRQQAACEEATLAYQPRPERTLAELRISRFRATANDLERAAQRLEATAQ